MQGVPCSVLPLRWGASRWAGRHVETPISPGEPPRFEVGYTLEDGLSGRGRPNFAGAVLLQCWIEAGPAT